MAENVYNESTLLLCAMAPPSAGGRQPKFPIQSECNTHRDRPDLTEQQFAEQKRMELLPQC